MRKYTVLVWMLLMVGCAENNTTGLNNEDNVDVPLVENFSFTLENDPYILNSLVVNRNESSTTKLLVNGVTIQDTMGVIVESQVYPPNFNTANTVEEVLSATHITDGNNGVYVTYHSNRPNNFEGGLQILDMNQGQRSIAMVQQATTAQFEWNHAYRDNNTIWLAGDAARGASLFAIQANGQPTIPQADSARVYNLHGPTANAVHRIADVIFVTVGGSNDAQVVLSDGRGQTGIYAIDAGDAQNSFATPVISSFSNLKHLGVDNGDLITLRHTSPNAQLLRFQSGTINSFSNLSNAGTFTPSNTYNLNVALNPTNAKNGMYIADNRIAYVAAGTSGLVSYNLSTGAIVDQIDFNGVNEFGNEELGGAVNAVWGDSQFLYVSAGSAFVIMPYNANGDLLEEAAKRIPLSYLVGDVNNDNVKNIDDITASQASVNYAYPVTSNGTSAQVLVAIGRAGVVYLTINMTTS